jgi:hypothetical protein
MFTPVALPPDRIPADVEHDRYRRGRGLRRKDRRFAADRHDHVNAAAHQIGGERGHLIVLALRPAIFDGDVLSFDVAGLF